MSTDTGCYLRRCNEPVSGVCIQCERPYCSWHGGPEAGYGGRCRDCYEQFLQNMVYAHHKANLLPEAVALLSRVDVETAPVEYLYYYGLALAASGEIDSALDCLGRIPEDGKTAALIGQTPVSAISDEFWTCSECEYKKNPKTSTRCEVCGKTRGAGGIKCPKCGTGNPYGSSACTSCREPLTNAAEAIGANVGIELPDGGMAVLIPQNTIYPTPRAFSIDIYTVEANQRQLEVILRQGESNIAAENDYCGVALIDLPPDLPLGTQVTIALGLDSDGTIMVTVQLRRFPNRKTTAHILRGGNAPMRRRRDALVQQAAEMLDRAGNVPEAEAVKEKFTELEQQQDLNAEELDAMANELEHIKALARERGNILPAVHKTTAFATRRESGKRAAERATHETRSSGPRVYDERAVKRLGEQGSVLQGRIRSVRAVRRLQANDAVGAADDLRAAIAVLEDNRAHREILTSIMHQAAFGYFKAGRLAEAAREWEEAQNRDPQDIQTAHCLGVVYYRMASEAEAQGSAEADEYWKNVIANWILVLSSEGFWNEWGQDRGAVVGPIDEGLLGEIRQDTAQRFHTEFRNFRTQYLAQSTASQAGSTQAAAQNKEDAERHLDLEALFVREKRAAEEMRKAMAERPNGHNGHNGKNDQPLKVACGPLMLERWRKSEAGMPLVKAAEALALDVLPLAQYLSALGTCYVLVKDLKQYDDAQFKLEAVLKTRPKDSEAKALLVESLVVRSQDSIDAGNLDGALAMLEKAAESADGKGEAVTLLADVAVKQSRKLLDEDATVQQGIDMLERIRRKYSPSTPEFKAQLAHAYFRRGVVRSHKEEWDGSLADMRTALSIDPNNAGAKENLARAINNKLNALVGQKKTDEAMTMMLKAMDEVPGQIDRSLGSLIFFNHGIDLANRAISNFSPYRKAATLEDLRSALVELDLAMKLDDGSGAAHIQKQINEVNAVVRKLTYGA